ncbi:hypothetical protein F2Q68_00041767 [Brassica cretica]|uniref:FBD domain-containing protein n=1 Tax=Brassica cretica TaxID=69181 RepID=A0A8S9MGE2_BRACR|nr:hypothetical protein F2Q68_00041767 [Brassica cretica]
MDFVDRVLVLHQHVPLNRFSLKCVDIVHPAIVIGWLLKVLEHAMLDLDLYISSVQGYPLPSEMFVSETLVRLKLEVRDVLTIDEALEELVLDNVFELTSNNKNMSFCTPNLVYLAYSDTLADEYPRVDFSSLVKLG